MELTESNNVDILRENLIHALICAIEYRRTWEANNGFTMPSAEVAGWRQVLAAVQAGAHVYVRD